MISENERTSDRIHDVCADQYGYDIEKSLASRLKRDLAVECIRPEHHVLDVGCANGLYMVALAKHCASIIGIDINDRMLELAQSALRQHGADNFQLLKQSASSIDFS